MPLQDCRDECAEAARPCMEGRRQGGSIESRLLARHDAEMSKLMPTSLCAASFETQPQEATPSRRTQPQI